MTSLVGKVGQCLQHNKPYRHLSRLAATHLHAVVTSTRLFDAPRPLPTSTARWGTTPQQALLVLLIGRAATPNHRRQKTLTVFSTAPGYLARSTPASASFFFSSGTRNFMTSPGGMARAVEPGVPEPAVVFADVSPPSLLDRSTFMSPNPPSRATPTYCKTHVRIRVGIVGWMSSTRKERRHHSRIGLVN